MGQTGKEIRPGERARIGVHDVDLELRHDHKGGHQEQHHGLVRDHVAEGHGVHARRFIRMLDGHTMGQNQHGEKRAGNHLWCPEHDPARAGQEQRQPVPAPGKILRRQKPQEVNLLTDLGHQRQDHGRRRAETDQADAVPAAARGPLCPRRGVDPGKIQPRSYGLPVGEDDEDEGQDVEDDPERLRGELKPADPGDAVRHQRDDRDRADDIAEPERHTEGELQGARHDRGLDCKEDEGEAGIYQRCHR